MFLFKVNKDGEVSEIRERPFKKEKHLQGLCERNLERIFELKFVRSEFIIHNFRIDTLAFDTEKTHRDRLDLQHESEYFIHLDDFDGDVYIENEENKELKEAANHIPQVPDSKNESQ